MRGEPGRVAERVRALLEEYGRAPASPTSGSSGGDGPAPSATRRGLRIDPGRRGALAVGVAVALAAVLTGAWVLAARPSALPVSASAPSGSKPNGSAPSGTASSGATPALNPSTRPSIMPAPGPSTTATVEVVVDVAGRVRHPGLYRLPTGARVDDAVRAAGGALPGVKLDALNLAATVVDGEQIAVGIAPAAGAGGAVAGGGAGAAPTGAGSGPVNLNTASLEQLQTLPGVGPVLAQHVLDWRAAHGAFRSIEQLNDVPGIGDVKFAALKSLVAV